MKILHNARLHTLDARQPQGTALVLEAGVVVAVGDECLLKQFPSANREDMGGRVVLPGLTDAHLHLQELALAGQIIDCELPGREQILDRVRVRAQQSAPGEWIRGHGWNQNTWGGEFPGAGELDEAAPHNPVYLTAKSLHAAWVNQAALDRAGVTAETPEPRGGVILRTADGKPGGVLMEKAMELVANVIPAPGPENLAALLKPVIRGLWELGLTGVHNFDRLASFTALRFLHERGELKLRVLQMVPRLDMDEAVTAGLCSGSGDDMLRIGQVKIFSDGALGPRTAAMFEPYVDEAENRGILLMDASDIHAIGCRAARAGFSLAIHAIGDRANHEAIAGLERLHADEKELGLPRLPHRIEHLQVLAPQDINRLGELGIVASMQPSHAISDMEMAERAWGARCALAYAWRTQVRCGARLAFGSDAPVEKPNPFAGLHAAVTRQSADGRPGPDGWQPQERLSIGEALQAFTRGPAHAAGMEDRLGRLAPGALADLIVLDVDPFTCDPVALGGIQPKATMVAGEWVWQA